MKMKVFIVLLCLIVVDNYCTGSAFPFKQEMSNSIHGNRDRSTASLSEQCQPDKLTVYKVVLHTFWSRDVFPKHYPDWRPPAQWSKVFGK